MEKRNIAVSDGTGMSGTMMVFLTDAPAEEFKRLEEVSRGGEPPIWMEEIEKRGYTMELVDQRPHMTAFGSSGSWLEKEYPSISETYIIED